MLLLQAQYVGKMAYQGWTALSTTCTARKVMQRIEIIRRGLPAPIDRLSEEDKKRFDGTLLGLAVTGIFFSRFRYLALVLFDDGIKRLGEWGYDGWVPWLLSYGVHAWVVFTDLRCYLLLARMVTRLVGAMVQEFERALHSTVEWLVLIAKDEVSVEETKFKKSAERVCCWCRGLDSWLGWVLDIFEVIF